MAILHWASLTPLSGVIKLLYRQLLFAGTGGIHFASDNAVPGWNPFQTLWKNQGVSHAQDDPLGVLRNAKDVARG